jgi:hypothetical protein
MNGLSGLRHALAGVELSLAMGVLAACGSDAPDPAGSGGLVGHMSGTSDVAGQPGAPAVGGGGLAVLPIAAMAGPFWDLVDVAPVANPRAWAVLGAQLSETQAVQLDGTVVPIDGDGDFRIGVPPGEYAVCYWPRGTSGRIWGCNVAELPAEGELKAFCGEAGFHIGVVD